MEKVTAEEPPTIVVLDAEGTVIGWTKTAETLFGYQAVDVLGRSGTALIMLDGHSAHTSTWAETIGDQEQWSGPARVRHRHGQEIRVHVHVCQVRIRGGKFCWLVTATPTGAAAMREWIAKASLRIGTTLDVKKTAQELADVAVPALADYATVDLAGTVLPEDEPLHRLDSSDVRIPVFRRAGMASIHEGFPEAIYRLGEAVYVPPESPFTGVLTSGRSYFEPIMDTSPGGWIDSERLAVIRKTGIHSLIIVPLRARGDILGDAVFVRTDNSAPFSPEDLRLAEGLAARTALSLDNARRYTRERTASLALQRHLLPRKVSGGDALDVASRYLPADVRYGVGGDLFDAIPLSDGRIALVVGDVTGHGINAAAGMGRLRAAVRTLAYLDLPPDEVLCRLDDLVARISEQFSESEGSLATFLYVVYDPASRYCTMATAGHPPPAIVTPDGTVTFPPLPTGTPIGLGVRTYESVRLELPEGSLIVLYTDGLIETREDSLDAGMDRLRAALSQDPTALLEDLCTTVINTMVADPFDDDIALLIARTRA
jgi:PAS domain S-box-containing protein